MSLRTKTLLITATALLVILLGLSIAFSWVLLGSYADLERDYVRRDVERVLQGLDREIDHLSSTAADWAFWDDTYRFVQDSNNDYVVTNLGGESIQTLRVNLMAFFNAGGEPVIARGFDLEQEREVPVSDGLPTLLREGGHIERHENPHREHKGVILTADGPMLVASRPVLTSERNGPCAGALVFGRYLDDAALARLSEVTRVEIRLHRPDEPEGQRIQEKLTASRAAGSTALVEPLDNRRIAGWAPLIDINGHVCLLLRTAAPRDIYYQGQSTLRRSLAVLVVVGLVLSGLTLLIIERMVLARLTRLTRDVKSITTNGNPRNRVAVLGRDELADLAGAINAMLKRISQFQFQLEAQQQQLRAQQAQLLETNRELEEASRRAAAASEHKSQFLANMSHEIRTPMTAILGFADSMLDGTFTIDEWPDMLRTIRRNGSYLLQLLSDILDISKIEAGRLTVEHIPCSAREIVDDVVSLMAVRAEAAKLRLNVEYADSIPEVIETDPTRLRQILMNVLGNAVKFTRVGSVRLVIGLLPRRSMPALMRFDVIDTGIGMTAEQAGSLFQAFTQADASTSRQFGGTGLGLTISRHLARMLGGDIEVVRTAPGVGTCLRVTVAAPLSSHDGAGRRPEMCDSEGRDAPRETWTPDKPLPRGCRVLLAEDGLDNQRLLCRILERAGTEVRLCTDGRAALESALEAHGRGEPFDLILMDMQMPFMDGYEATRRLRAAGYSGPIIALTAHAMAADREKCLQAGCNDYLSKPVDRKKMIETIRRQLTPAPLA